MKHWYEIDTELLEMEKIAMSRAFPHFTLDKLDDGRLYWVGELTPGFYETKFNERLTYTVMVVYNHNHLISLQQEFASSSSTIRVYPVDTDDIINRLGFIHHRFRTDSANNLYLDMGAGSAASVVGRVLSWLFAYELALAGEIEMDLFKK
jgi:hypothetical protein